MPHAALTLLFSHARTAATCGVLVLATVLAAPAASVVTIDWVTVGAPGNAADTDPFGVRCGLSSASPCGTVNHTYRIGKYEVTNAQYAEFLNAKATAQPLRLYSTEMGSGYGGITRSGTSIPHRRGCGRLRRSPL